MSDLKVEIVTPQGIVFSDAAQSCTVPGAEGQFQVLKNHADMLAVLEVGKIRVNGKEGEKTLATSGGYIEIKKNYISIVVESAEFAEQIDIERAKSAQERAKERLLVKKGETDVFRAEFALLRALNRIKIASQI